MFKCSHNKGFTLPELVVSIAIIMIIFGFAGINLYRIVPNASLSEISGSFIADAKSQQHSAMVGESTGTSQIDYSIKIDEHTYTIFRGRVFSAGDPGNYTMDYPTGITASTTFPNRTISFAVSSGEIIDYDANTNQVVFNGADNTHLTIKFNKLGNVYYVNKI